MAKHNKVGQNGELIAQDYLKSKGYNLIICNYRKGKAEVDIIAMQPTGEYVFVEVKTRSTISSRPEEAIGLKKKSLLIQAAIEYKEDNEIVGETFFDIITIQWIDNEKYTLTHFKDVFYA